MYQQSVYEVLLLYGKLLSQNFSRVKIRGYIIIDKCNRDIISVDTQKPVLQTNIIRVHNNNDNFLQRLYSCENNKICDPSGLTGLIALEASRMQRQEGASMWCVYFLYCSEIWAASE